MELQRDRIQRVQVAMREQGMLAIVVMNHDDYRYFFGEDRAQPRAILPMEGPPELIVFEAEAPELEASLGADAGVRVFTTVGGQIHDVGERLRHLMAILPDAAGQSRPKVGMQLWFETPAFLVDLFRKVNPAVELVSSDPVMDPIRAIKDDRELELMAEAQRVAGLGMDRARGVIRAGASAQEVATEVVYAMMRAGAERTSTPVYVNVGADTCMLHGRLSAQPIRRGDLVLVDLTPQVGGYCANLTRTFAVGTPAEWQAALIEAYRESVDVVRLALRPGACVADLDEAAGAVYRRHGFGERQVLGIGHGIGLRFEETPASTIIPPHRRVPLRAGMTMTIGHTILALPGQGGVRFEDVYRVTEGGGVALAPYPIDPVLID